MFNKIVFFHNHVNGDCFLSRILVKQIIDATKDKNIVYYYTAPRSYVSWCLDLGIPDEHFNKISVSHSHLLYYIENDILFINVWVGITTGTEQDQNITCALCLNNLIPKYNFLIKLLNEKTNMNIELLNEDANISPYVEINYEYYNCNFIDNFIIKNKETYEKIVLICNNSPTTFISMKNISQLYLSNIIDKFPKYLFITFENENLIKSNLISIKEIYKQSDIPIPNNWGIMFSLLAKLCDKVVLLPTGPALACFNNQIHENKFMMLFDYSDSGNPDGCNYCKNSREKLCTNRFSWDITLMDVNYNDVSIKDKICYFIEDFLQK